jgi:hypothetical protein
MWRYFGLTKRGTPVDTGGNLIEAKLDFLVREFEKSQRSDVVSFQSSQEPGDPIINAFRYAITPMLGENGITDIFIGINPSAIPPRLDLYVDEKVFDRMTYKLAKDINDSAASLGYELFIAPLHSLTGPRKSPGKD